MRLSRRALLGTAPVLLTAGCVAPAAGGRYTGHYSWGFEESAFRPCGRDEAWWVVNDAALVDRYRSVVSRDYEPAFAVLRGLVSDPGSYGHQGAYDRQFEVTRVITVRRAREADC